MDLASIVAILIVAVIVSVGLIISLYFKKNKDVEINYQALLFSLLVVVVVLAVLFF